MGWYIAIGILVLALWTWPLVEGRFRPAHVAALKAGRKCIRCGQPISEGDASIPAQGHRFGRAHVECEKDGEAHAGCSTLILIATTFFYSIPFVAYELPDLAQGKIGWSHAVWGRRALFLLAALVADRFYAVQRRRRVDRFVSRHPQHTNESKQGER